eukprot:7365455-Prymnesium_polylepis.1
MPLNTRRRAGAASRAEASSARSREGLCHETGPHTLIATARRHVCVCAWRAPTPAAARRAVAEGRPYRPAAGPCCRASRAAPPALAAALARSPVRGAVDRRGKRSGDGSFHM